MPKPVLGNVLVPEHSLGNNSDATKPLPKRQPEASLGANHRPGAICCATKHLHPAWQVSLVSTSAFPERFYLLALSCQFLCSPHLRVSYLLILVKSLSSLRSCLLNVPRPSLSCSLVYLRLPTAFNLFLPKYCAIFLVILVITCLPPPLQKNKIDFFNPNECPG